LSFIWLLVDKEEEQVVNSNVFPVFSSSKRPLGFFFTFLETS